MGKGRPDMVSLNDTNYRQWKLLIGDLLVSDDLHEAIENEGARPEGITEADWKKKDRKACSFIRSWVGITVVHHVENEVTAYGVWSKLESLYAGKSAGNKAALV